MVWSVILLKWKGSTATVVGSNHNLYRYRGTISDGFANARNGRNEIEQVISPNELSGQNLYLRFTWEALVVPEVDSNGPLRAMQI